MNKENTAVPEFDEDENTSSDTTKTETESIHEEDTFPREYVEKLRKEAGDHRARAKDRDELARRLHRELVAKLDRLQDPEDLDFNEEHLTDPEALKSAVDALLEAKPHLASRRPRGNIGQGVNSTATTVDLAALLRSRA